MKDLQFNQLPANIAKVIKPALDKGYVGEYYEFERLEEGEPYKTGPKTGQPRPDRIYKVVRVFMHGAFYATWQNGQLFLWRTKRDESIRSDVTSLKNFIKEVLPSKVQNNTLFQ